MKLQKKGEIDKIIDPNLTGQIKAESLKKFVETVEKCLAECGLDRPTMGEVLWNLEYALQLQDEDDASSNASDDVSLQIDEAQPLQTLPSTRQYSMGSAGDLVDIFFDYQVHVCSCFCSCSLSCSGFFPQSVICISNARIVLSSLVFFFFVFVMKS